MEHSKLAALLLEVSDADQAALLRHHAADADSQLAYLIKDSCLNGWSSNPGTSLKANSILQSLAKLNSDPEIAALAAWTAGIEGLVLGRMGDAIGRLEDSRLRFLALDKPLVAASTEVSKLIGLAMLGRYDEAVEVGLRAREVFLRHGDLLAAGKIEHNLGNLSFRRDRYHEAEEFQSSAREHFAALNDQKQLATINNCLANTHALLHKFESAEQLYQEAIVQAEAAELLVTLAEIEGNIGTFALLRGRYDRALDYLERSRRRYTSLGMPHQSAIAELEIADAHFELNLVPEAADVYDRVIQTFQDLGLRAEAARALASYGRALIFQEKPQEALKLLEEARYFMRCGRELCWGGYDSPGRSSAALCATGF